MIKAYVAYLEANGRGDEAEAIKKMPSMKGLGDHTALYDVFHGHVKSLKLKELRKVTPSGTLAEHYGSKKEEDAEKAASVTRKITAIKEMFALLRFPALKRFLA